MDLGALAQKVRQWTNELGFDEMGITDTDLSHVSSDYRQWLRHRFHGEMSYMNRNIEKRLDPQKLLPSTVRIISARMNYDPIAFPQALKDPSIAYISRYALGRDYHKVVRRRLAKVAARLREAAGGTHRAFVDSAPVLEKPIAAKAGLGWVGKNTLILNEQAGSYFFLGEIFTDIPLPVTEQPVKEQCGSCRACMTKCPTGAIVGPKELDARQCISYLTIEHKGEIPRNLRKMMGNRIFGCDDCQIVCPWNRFVPKTKVEEFSPRHQLDQLSIETLLSWDEETFMDKTEGMAIRRISYEQWVRNLAVAAGNAPTSPSLVRAVREKRVEMNDIGNELCLEHLDWALEQLKIPA